MNLRIILAEYDRILRRVVSIKLKERTPSDILRRLNSCSRQHALCRALKASGQIIRTLFILRHADDRDMRREIEIEFCRIEDPAISPVWWRSAPHGFRQTEKEGQDIADRCNRLARNSIVVRSYLWLTRKLETTQGTAARQALIQTMGQRSPMVREHVSMLGESDFSDDKLCDTPVTLPRTSRTR